ncbi:MAG: SAM-dependent methyltransferase [SAR86 cluster bacterium]|uniref:SAM-dependent methyltransferase n=1 Tax=SAR86 cluster bacterium TaxID=2030880 RepID=A0A2A4WZ41_9GAMM|nr:MAG: SAM-dependent methyltransferase [SAR86 cluster bacterium]
MLVNKEIEVLPSSDYEDFSNGWEAIASKFISIATWEIGAATVQDWSKSLQPGQIVLDVGCGFGGPYTKALINKGIKICGIDASKTLIQEYQNRFPDVIVKCEAAEHSPFFGREFDGILSVGLIFLLSHDDQILVLQKMANALKEGGKLLFSSPYQICDWDDLSTGRKSISLGKEMYVSVLQKHGLILIDEDTDEGENHYFNFQKMDAL